VKKLKVPPEVDKQCRLLRNDTKVQEVITFIGTQLTGTHINVILAARIADDWFELYRWNSSWKQLGFSAVTVRDV